MGKPKRKARAIATHVSDSTEKCRDNLQRAGITPDELYRLNLLPISRNAIYNACARGEIESFRMGRKIVIPTAALKRKLGIEA